MCASKRELWLSGSALIFAGLALAAAPAMAQTDPSTAPQNEIQVAAADTSNGGLGDLSIEELVNVPVTSVSRSAQPVGEAPAAIYVITSDDMTRAGVRSIPGALRLAPNLQVARLDAADYGITARGFNQSSGTANKLLVMMDGRIVYTPLFSGVFWDEQNPIIEDLDRIEVVSGPGGTLWGSNAVNGVINIVSRDAHETQGMLATAGLSESTQSLGVRYGGWFGGGAFRVYGLGQRRAVGDPNEFDNLQGGFRGDWGDANTTFTLQGDVYHGQQDQQPGQISETAINGGNVLGRWTRRFDNNSSFQIQAYVDRAARQVSSDIRADVNSQAVDAQYNFSTSARNAIVVGAGVRVTNDDFAPGPGTAFLDPDSRGLTTYSGYVQDTVAITTDVDLIAGLKVENNSYTGVEYMPSARIAWRPADDTLVWAAVSRAVRTPSRFDRDLFAPGVLDGGPNFESESLIAYELGYRAQPNDRFWYSISTYYNVYDDLRTLEAESPPAFVPLQIRNGMHGNTYGLEAWGSFAVTDFWRVNAGLSFLQKDLALDPGSADVTGVGFAGNDPKVQATVRSLVDLNPRTQFDVAVRYVGELPEPEVPSYVAVDMRLGYQVTEHFEISLAGYNLFDDEHVEFINPSLPAQQSPRSFFLTARWRS
ncbi:MAG: TonB-dependent receptor [Terricaulis sp.]